MKEYKKTSLLLIGLVLIFPSALFAQQTLFSETWNDGKAEVSRYTYTQSRYGQQRHGTAFLIFVTEEHDADNRVKISDSHAGIPTSKHFPVIKLNVVRSFQTGVYDYHLMTTVIARLDRALMPSRISASIQEWGGHVFQQLTIQETRVDETLHSYFSGEADSERQYPMLRPSVFEDEIPLLVRELQGPWITAGESREFDSAPSLITLRLQHKPFVWGKVQVFKSAKTEKIKSPLGITNVYRWTINTPSSGIYTYLVEAAWPHRILEWSSDLGESGTLTETTRMPYWELTKEGDESSRLK